MTSKVDLRCGSTYSILLMACVRQHSVFILQSYATYSSLTMSIPSVAQIVNRTPKSNISFFLSSFIEAD